MPRKITIKSRKDGKSSLSVPDDPIIPVIEGDGVGPALWAAAGPILEKAARKCGLSITWLPVLAGAESKRLEGDYLPAQTLSALESHRVSIKGPLSTPVGGGIRSLNVAIRQALDLYACLRPVKYIPGGPSPVKNPQLVDMIIFRENTEDVYSGLEWEASSQEAEGLRDYLASKLNVKIRPGSAIGLKPMSQFGSDRLIRMAIEWALKENRPSLTLVHKGNIMKFTEGAFRAWGYRLAREEYPDRTVPEAEVKDEKAESRLIIKDRIADNMFMQTLLRPAEYSVLATPNLNGDYLSDALAAQIGGLGLAPGGNLGDNLAVFEATHGTAPKYVGQDYANPSSLILSGAMMLDYLGWPQAGDLVRSALAQTLAQGIMTGDLARQIPGAKAYPASLLAREILDRI
jgi:isocitrate dehydrogenase